MPTTVIVRNASLNLKRLGAFAIAFPDVLVVLLVEIEFEEVAAMRCMSDWRRPME